VSYHRQHRDPGAQVPYPAPWGSCSGAASPKSTTSAIYGYDLLLLRSDLHVVWRGNRPLDNPAELAAIATGHHVSRGRLWNE